MLTKLSPCTYLIDDRGGVSYCGPHVLKKIREREEEEVLEPPFFLHQGYTIHNACRATFPPRKGKNTNHIMLCQPSSGNNPWRVKQACTTLLDLNHSRIGELVPWIYLLQSHKTFLPVHWVVSLPLTHTLLFLFFLFFFVCLFFFCFSVPIIREMKSFTKASNNNNNNKKTASSRRVKVTLACIVCRKKKVKCNGVQPTCARCHAMGIDCQYSDPPKKRGPPKGHVEIINNRAHRIKSLLGKGNAPIFFYILHNGVPPLPKKENRWVQAAFLSCSMQQ